jgi:hypothetical protein
MSVAVEACVSNGGGMDRIRDVGACEEAGREATSAREGKGGVSISPVRGKVLLRARNLYAKERGSEVVVSAESVDRVGGREGWGRVGRSFRGRACEEEER